MASFDFLEKKNNPRNGPKLFNDFSKAASDLLIHEIGVDNVVFKVSTVTTSGQILRSSVVFARYQPFASLEARHNYKDSSFGVHFCSASKPWTNLVLRKQLLEFTGASVSFRFPDYNCSSLLFVSGHKYCTFGSFLDLTRNPNIAFQASLGTQSLAIGGGAIYHSASHTFRGASFGVQATTPSFSTSLCYTPRSSLLQGTCFHYLDKAKKVSVALEIHRAFREEQYLFVAGGSWRIDSLSTIVKATIDHTGVLKTQLYHRIKDHGDSWVTILTTFDTYALNRMPKIGLSVVLVP